MEITKQNRTLITLVTIAVLGLVSFVIFKYDRPPDSMYTNVNLNPGGVLRSDIPALEIPKNIPGDAPFLRDGTVTDNFTISEGTNSQSVRKWTVNQATAKTAQSFAEYLKNGGWTIHTSYENKGTTAIGATKNNLALSLSVTQGTNKTQSVIEITVNTK